MFLPPSSVLPRLGPSAAPASTSSGGVHVCLPPPLARQPAAPARASPRRRHHDEVVSTLEKRVATWTKYNVTHQEDIQV